MKKKPILILFLAIFHFIQPLINILYLKFTTEYDFSLILQNLMELDGVKSNFDFWLLFPLGGISLLLVRRWSFFLFVAVQFYSIYLHLFYEKYTWPYVSKNPLFFSVFLLICNLLFISYVFLPNIRILFFDKTKRWWQTSRRYFLGTPCKLTVISSGISFDSRIINISKTGSFVECNQELPKDTFLVIEFNHDNKFYSLTGKLVSLHMVDNIKGLGIKFLLDKFHADERPILKGLIKSLSKVVK